MSLRHLGIMLALGLGFQPGLCQAAAPVPREPADDVEMYSPFPRLTWDVDAVPPPEAMYDHVIQIAADEGFARVVDEDRIAAVIRWYVPAKPLPPGRYWWRVGAPASGGGQQWSPARSLTIAAPPRVFRVKAGASFADIRRVLAEASTQTPARVEFERGVYRLDPGSPQAPLALAGTTNLVVDGGGSTLVLLHPAPLIEVRQCARVVLTGFAFDFDPPVYTAGRVSAVDLKAGTIEAEILPGHVPPDAARRYDEDRKGEIVTEADACAIKRGVPLVVEHDGFEKVAERRYRFRFDPLRWARHFAPGDVYVLGPRWMHEGGGGAATVLGGSDVVFHDLAIRGAANECLGSFYADYHAILGVRLERAPGRVLSVNNGGNNHHNARHGPWIEGCLFENTGDDICHINGYAMGIAAQPAPDRLVFSRRQPYDVFSAAMGLDLRPGDRLRFFNEAEGRLLAERTVARADARERDVEVALDRAVEGLKVGSLLPSRRQGYPVMEDLGVTQVFNADRGCNQFVFRGNACRNGRRVGVLAKGEGGLIEQNTFEGLGGGGVEFWNAPFEGLAAENYVVRSNRVAGCVRLAREDAPIWTTIFRTGVWRGHRNLLLEGNDLADNPAPAILLRDAEHVVLRGNRLPAAGDAVRQANTEDVGMPGPVGVAGAAGISGELKQWHKVTLAVDGPYASERDREPNPFTDCRMAVVFAHESGAPVYTVPGYFAADGNAAESGAESGTAWRAHLSPDKTGTWTYTVSFVTGRWVAVSNAPGAAFAPCDGRTGKFTVAPTDKTGRDFRARGRLQVSGGRYLRFAGTGEYFLKAGADAPENFLACADFDGTRSLKSRTPRAGEAVPAGLKTWKPHVRDWRPGDPEWGGGRGRGIIGALNYLAGKGVNAFSFLTYNVGGDGQDVWPFVAPDDKLHYDCSKLDQWGVVFDHATARGLHLHFKLQEQENDDNRLGGDKGGVANVPSALDGGDLGAGRKLYLRELIARFGHELALNWNLGEENTQTPEQQRAMAQFIRDTDPYDHPIVIHTYPNWQDRVYSKLLGDQSALTGVSLQNGWRDAHARTLKWVAESERAGKPWVVANDEQNPASLGVPPDPGYAGFGGRAGEGKDAYDLHDVRKMVLWGNLMAGGGGVEYYFGYQLPQNDLVCEDWRSRDRSWDYARIALDVFRDQRIPFWEMRNADALVGNPKGDNSRWCLAKPAEVYVVYLPSGGTTDLDLGPGTAEYRIGWFNPRVGGALQNGSKGTAKGPGRVSIGLPPTDANDDWVTIIRREANHR